jgi:hypothetical protein
MRARRSRSQHARRWERGRLACPANRARKTYPFEGEGREWGDSARAGICELWLGDWYYYDTERRLRYIRYAGIGMEEFK